jgi:hypothetical protein
MVKLKTKLLIKDKRYGNTYEVFDADSGRTFTIDEFPRSQRSRGDAKYIVEERGKNSLGWQKTRTLPEAKEIIKKVV